MSAIKVGDIVPLLAELECFDNETVYIRAFIFDKDNTNLAQIDLTNKNDGSFDNYLYLMPNVEVLRVKYIPYVNPSYTVEHSDFCQSAEIFYKLDCVSDEPIEIDISGLIEKVDELIEITRPTDIHLEMEEDDMLLVEIHDDVNIELLVESDDDLELFDLKIQDDEEIELIIEME